MLLLVSNEWDDRKNRAVERAVRIASFRYKASVKQIDYSIERGLDRNQMHRLAALDFIKERKDLFITGSTGTGKSLSGNGPRLSGLSGMYVNTAKFMGHMKLAKAKGHDTGRTQTYRANGPANPRPHRASLAARRTVRRVAKKKEK